MTSRPAVFGAAFALTLTLLLAWRLSGSRKIHAGAHSVDSRLRQFGTAARARLQPFFERAGVPYPGTALVFVALKDVRRLELYAAHGASPFCFIREYPILGASGGPGPKLREGDHQVPEGIYALEALNPNSRFHVSLRVNYPNAQDLLRAAAEGRDRPGSDIMIHGGADSVGCLAMGDSVAEELFTLAAAAGLDQIRLLSCPSDFRTHADFAPPLGAPAWVGAMYRDLGDALRALGERPGAPNGGTPAHLPAP